MLDDWAILVTALLLMKRPHACGGHARTRARQDTCFVSGFRVWFGTPTLSRAATKPASLLKADMTKALYFLCTSRVVCTYTFGSCKDNEHESCGGTARLTLALRRPSYVERRLSALLDGGQALVVDVGLQQLLQLSQTVRDAGHQVVHPAQI